MHLRAHLAKIARELRDGIATDLPRQQMDYAARQLEQLVSLPLPEIDCVTDAGDKMLYLHLKRPITIIERQALQVFLTGELP